MLDLQMSVIRTAIYAGCTANTGTKDTSPGNEQETDVQEPVSWVDWVAQWGSARMKSTRSARSWWVNPSSSPSGMRDSLEACIFTICERGTTTSMPRG